jgi:hypothetical protein
MFPFLLVSCHAKLRLLFNKIQTERWGSGDNNSSGEMTGLAGAPAIARGRRYHTPMNAA